MKDFTMVIPTYWGKKDTDGYIEDVVFDHPTMLHEEGTLGRLLQSLDVLEQFDGKIVIIAVGNRPDITAEVEDKVESIVRPFHDRYDITIMSQFSLERLKGKLVIEGVGIDALTWLNLGNYAAVRNICSLAGILNRSAYTIFIDDDEVFRDREFLTKIDSSMQHVKDGTHIQALAGYYLQPESYYLDETRVPAWRRPYWNNTRAMNLAFKQIIESEPRIKPTPFVFGGNMTLSLDVLKKTPFDPKITRGEDIDFLLNLKINNMRFYLDRKLAITHLPPPSRQPSWKKLREDAVRFMYERKKIRDHEQINLEDLQPYPGMFLGDDLEERIIKTNELLIGEYRQQGDEVGICECEKTIALIRENSWEKIDTLNWLKELFATWQQLASAAEGMGI